MNAQPSVIVYKLVSEYHTSNWEAETLNSHLKQGKNSFISKEKIILFFFNQTKLLSVQSNENNVQWKLF